MYYRFHLAGQVVDWKQYNLSECCFVQLSCPPRNAVGFVSIHDTSFVDLSVHRVLTTHDERIGPQKFFDREVLLERKCWILPM